MIPPGQPGALPLPSGRTRVALLDFTVEGDAAGSPATAMQLQDGFVIGLLRGGVDLIDAGDVKKRLADAPELQGCETSPCLKRIGEALAVRQVVRVRVQTTGNSYRMTGRLFSTEGATPAALPVAAQSRACEACTVGEAREQMIRLADGLRARIEEAAPPARPVPVVKRPSRLAPLSVAVLGVAAIVSGALVLRQAPEHGKRRPAIGGALMGVGLPLSLIGLWSAVSPSPTSVDAPVESSP